MAMANIDVDINSLFSFQKDFDVLKHVLDALMKMQRTTQEQITSLTEDSKQKDEQIRELYSHIETLAEGHDGFFPDNPNIENSNENNNQTLTKNESGKISPQKRKISFQSKSPLKSMLSRKGTIADGNQVGLNLANDSEEIDKIAQRVARLEAMSRSNDHEENKRQNETALKELNEKFEEVRTLTKEHTEKLEQISVKVMDFDIYDMFKGSGKDSGNSSMVDMMVMSAMMGQGGGLGNLFGNGGCTCNCLKDAAPAGSAE